MKLFDLNDELSVILCFLQPKDVLLGAGMTCRFFHAASRRRCVWACFVSQLWTGKVFVDSRSRELVNENPMLAYQLSLQWSKCNLISEEILTSRSWSFRFKEEAGGGWLHVCPWNHGLSAFKVRFTEDHRIVADEEFSQNEDLRRMFEELKRCWRLATTTGRRRSARTRRGYPNIEEEDERLNIELLQGGYSDQVVVELNNIPVPSYHVSRSPTGNWGFVLESCWAVYTSWEMPKKGESSEMDNLQNVTANDQWEAIRQYNRRILSETMQEQPGEY